MAPYHGSSRSPVIAAPIAAIARTSIAPSTSSVAMSPVQQSAQCPPRRRPARKAAPGPDAGRAGEVVGNSSQAPFTFNDNVGHLLGTCPAAAFAAQLAVWAAAINGYGRQSQYDAYATVAFALIS